MDLRVLLDLDLELHQTLLGLGDVLDSFVVSAALNVHQLALAFRLHVDLDGDEGRVVSLALALALEGEVGDGYGSASREVLQVTLERLPVRGVSPVAVDPHVLVAGS